MSRDRSQLEFTKIDEARVSSNRRINLIGMVTENGLPKTTKGTDVFCSLKIIDESAPKVGFYIHFFAETMDKLPHVKARGDIIVVSQVMVKHWESDFFAVYNKNFSSFVLFEGINCSVQDIVPYQMSSRYGPQYQEKEFIMKIMEVKKWPILHVDDPDDLKSLREIKESKLCNLICKVLHISRFKEDEWIVYIWDGTDAPPASVKAKLEDEYKNALPLHLEETSLSIEFLCTFPRIGTVVRMVIKDKEKQFRPNFLVTGRWVKLMYVRFELHAALWYVLPMSYPKFCYLADDDSSVIARQGCYEKRQVSEWGKSPSTCLPEFSFITEIDSTSVPSLTLMDFIAHPQDIGKCICIVRVMAMVPWELKDISAAPGKFRLRFTLEDPTARIHAFFLDNGEEFFGYDHHSRDRFVEKRNILLGVGVSSTVGGGGSEDVPRNPPWVKICLFHYPTDRTRPQETRKNLIIETKLVC